mgnify:FL=1
MGRNPTPNALLKLEKGVLYDEQRDRAKLEPKPMREIKPRCPARFSKAERKAWKEIAAVLKNYGIFTAANAIQLELLSTAWAQYLEMCAKMAETKSIIMETHDGGWMYSPWYKAQHHIGGLVDRYSQNLGLSSMQLAKIGSLMLKKKKESNMESLLD